MPTAFTVAGRLTVIGSVYSWAVPAPGTGVELSVVYQIEVLPRGPAPEVKPGSVRVTVSGLVYPPGEGEMDGATEAIADTLALVTFPDCVGAVPVHCSFAI